MSFNDNNSNIIRDHCQYFSIAFDALLDNDDIVDLLYEFTGQNTAIDFLRDVKIFRSSISSKRRLELMHQLYDKYIDNASLKQINLPSGIYRTIHDKVMQRNADNLSQNPIVRRTTVPSCSSLLSTYPIILSGSSWDDLLSVSSSSLVDSVDIPERISISNDVYTDAFLHVIVTLRDNYMNDFLSSAMFLKYLVGKKLSLLYSIGYLKEGNIMHYIKSMNNVRIHTMHDFNFIRNQVESSKEYRVLKKFRYGSISVSNHRFDVGLRSKNIHVYKLEKMFGWNADFSIHRLTDQFQMYEPYLVSSDVIMLHSRRENTYASRITRDIYRPGWPIKDKEFIITSSGIKYTDGCYVVTSKTCQLMDDTTRCFSFGGFMVQPLSSDVMKYSKLFYTDLGHGLLNKLMHKSMVKYYHQLCDSISQLLHKRVVSGDSYASLFGIINENSC